MDYLPARIDSSNTNPDEFIPKSYADSMLDDARIKVNNTLTFNTIHNTETVPDGDYVWSSATDENSEEEINTEEPCVIQHS